MSYTHITPAARSIALSLANGRYQDSLLGGSEAWSGSTLKGSARKHSGRYHASRQDLLARLRACPDLEVRDVTGPHNRRELDIRVVGELTADVTGEDAEALAGIAA
ncbi:hypothetical protein ASF49_08240 [Methylobacterium sp. Leaf104]|uniref:hypothetical protein n=1 Tax=Methylobacterium TaxID=407 RepID=UPI0006F3BE37|nr:MULTISPECIES: hypothetical protein [Methylobacterium]KQP33846.1 hypothetical protein ASF49_08240 [Methylobacterium sp. Leaf104]MCI9879584.1 hypothetical protein [Methylobacterium goesingense]